MAYRKKLQAQRRAIRRLNGNAEATTTIDAPEIGLRVVFGKREERKNEGRNETTVLVKAD
jgi:hypothetical protein